MVLLLMDSHKTFQLGLKLLGYIGLDPTKRTTKAIIFSGIGFTYLVLLVVLIIVGFFNDQVTVQRFAKLCQALGSVLFTLCKQYVLMVYWRDIRMIMSQPVLDWPIKNKDQTKVISLNKALKIVGGFIVVCVLNFFFLALKPWIVDELPLGFSSPFISFWIIYFIQIMYMHYAFMVMYGFDMIFAAVCIHHINQLRYLGFLFENLTFFDQDNMKEGVLRHVALMRTVNAITKVYSLIFTTTIWIAITIMCVESYVDMNKAHTFMGYLRHGTMQLGALFLCSFYVILASKVTDEGVNIAEAIYRSKWFEADLSVRKYVLIVMMRAQVPLNFTASGFAVISRLTILFILQTAYTYYTVFRNLTMAHAQN